MVREMRRKLQQLSAEETESVLRRGTYGVLALHGDDGFPYAVPISYAYADGKLYFHCAMAGHKLDAMKRDEKASFCVVDQNEVHPEKFTTYFRSVIAFGRVRILEDEAERRAALMRIAEKFGPDGDVGGQNKEVDATIARASLAEFTIIHVTGKQAKELVKKQ